MNRFLTACAVLAISAASAFSAELCSKSGSVDMYANFKRDVNEKAVYTASPSETFIEVSRKGDKIQVRTKTGQELWVEARLVKKYEASQGANMDLGAGKIEGYLDNPQAVYILQEENSAMSGINLERSFVEAIQGNVDRETIESRNGETR